MSKCEETRIGILGHVDSGKCFGIDTPILLYNKSVKMIQDIKINDILMGDDMNPRKVIETITGVGPLYKVSQNNGIDYIVNESHILSLKLIFNNEPIKDIIYIKKILEPYTDTSDILQYNYDSCYNHIIDIGIRDYLKLPNNIKSVLWGYRSINKTKQFSNNSNYSSNYSSNYNSNYINTIDVTKISESGYYYGVTIDKNNRFLLKDYTVVHNSTITGIITKSEKDNIILDDGRGKMRNFILKHPHEKVSGRTSDIAQHYIRYYNSEDTDSRVKVFIDLAGHEKYLRVTLNGITKCQIDYAALVVAANMGVLRMTREHLGIILSLKLPLFIILTKIDISPENVTNNTLKDINNIFNICRKRKLINLTTSIIRNRKDLEDLLSSSNNSGITNNCNNTSIVPIFPISSVTGENIDILLEYIRYITPIKNYETYLDDGPVFTIESTYQVPGIGLVVSGLLKSGTIKKDDVLYIGPFYTNFIKIVVKSIHNNFKENINKLVCGNSGCLNIKTVNSKIPLKRNYIKHGIKIVKSPQLYWKFKASITILHHHTTIKEGYNPFIHCGNISQTCEIEKIIDKEFLRVNDTSEVILRFKYKPEYIEPNTKIVFRDGKTKGVGNVLEIIQ